MMTRNKAERNHRRLVAQRNATASGTPERLRAELNLHMGRWTLNCNNFTSAEIAELEKPRDLHADLSPEQRRQISRMISPKSRQWLKKALLKKHDGSN